jgi:hypothetical protein
LELRGQWDLEVYDLVDHGFLEVTGLLDDPSPVGLDPDQAVSSIHQVIEYLGLVYFDAEVLVVKPNQVVVSELSVLRKAASSHCSLNRAELRLVIHVFFRHFLFINDHFCLSKVDINYFSERQDLFPDDNLLEQSTCRQRDLQLLLLEFKVRSTKHNLSLFQLSPVRKLVALELC